MPVFQLSNDIIFPAPDFAEPDGLLAIGGDLSAARLITAYRQGIFPWYSEGDPILWWSPAPRLVLLPEQFHLPRRLARTIRKQQFQVSADTAFAEVISSCASLRKESGEGTWITEEMKDAYIHLHELGFAHSVECWFEGKLAGGLYGVCLDRVFFGESMFSRKSDASKIALATLIRYAEQVGIRAIDCQMSTSHLLRFGSREIEREEFQEILERFIQIIVPQKKWRLR
ncbi:MAG: leucyl/phenylalanyl-tRNA--protein transferase [Thermodesulfobacteriota bacterium]|nr:leucyl/phenylalanyl-tRNA--protein transferase [Thermodesulfobacteriota bacterium]